MWFLLERLFLIFLVLIFFTDFLYPLIMNKPLFWNFRKKKTDEPKSTGEPDVLKEKIVKAKEKVKEVKDVQDEVTDFHKKSKDLKDEADDLLK